LATNEYWPAAFVRRRPSAPLRAAPETTVALPVPGAPSQLARLPDSNPSAKSTFV
jgi:hypothetical protein